MEALFTNLSQIYASKPGINTKIQQTTKYLIGYSIIKNDCYLASSIIFFLKRPFKKTPPGQRLYLHKNVNKKWHLLLKNEQTCPL